MPTSPPCCFMAGTNIRVSAAREVRVEDLAIGDMVLTAAGREAPVRWIGRQTVSTTFADPARHLPVRIRAGALADNLPVRDLLVSPCHAILVDDVLVQAGALVNSASIVTESDVSEVFTYYHLELDDHALILAEGVPAETFVDNVQRMAFDNWSEHLEVFPDGHPIPEMDRPRAMSARQVPAAIRRRLSERALLNAGAVAAAA